MGWYLAYSIYFIALFAIGIYYYFRVTTSTDYNIAGWNMGFGQSSEQSSALGVVQRYLLAGLYGIYSRAIRFLQICFSGRYVLFDIDLLFARPLRRQKLFTLADFFGERYGNDAGIIPSILSAFIYSIPTTAIQMIGMSTVFLMCFNIPLKQGVILSALLMLGFTILGGLPATIITDALQSFLVVIGIVILLIASIIHGGGLANIIENTPTEYLTPVGPEGLSAVLLFALSVGPFYLVWQSTWQRIFAAKDEKTARNAGLTGFGIVAVISLIPYLVGVMARQYVPLDLEPNIVFSYVTVEVLPPPIAGIVFIGLWQL